MQNTCDTGRFVEKIIDAGGRVVSSNEASSKIGAIECDTETGRVYGLKRENGKYVYYYDKGEAVRMTEYFPAPLRVVFFDDPKTPKPETWRDRSPLLREGVE
jgi:hypothetical protein